VRKFRSANDDCPTDKKVNFSNGRTAQVNAQGKIVRRKARVKKHTQNSN
jgi:hypothetical protein